MTTARKPNSTSPARQAAKKATADRAAEAAAAELQAARDEAMRRFAEYEPGPAQLDADGYEIIPDRAQEPGGTYKFRVGGEAFELPNLQYLPMAIAQQLPHLDEAGGMQLVLSRYAPSLLEHAHADQFMHISKRWIEHSKGLTLGE